MTETVQHSEPPHPDPLPKGEGEMRAPSARKYIFTAIKYAICIAALEAAALVECRVTGVAACAQPSGDRRRRTPKKY